jgi:hypothetical protein
LQRFRFSWTNSIFSEWWNCHYYQHSLCTEGSISLCLIVVNDLRNFF